MRILSIGSQERALIELDLDELVIKEFIDRIEPIPLTPEILEKNGFKRYEHSEALWDVGVERLDEGLFAVGIEDDCGVGLCVMPGEIMTFYCKYVHELQHILRLCGVKKEVIL